MKYIKSFSIGPYRSLRSWFWYDLPVGWRLEYEEGVWTYAPTGTKLFTWLVEDNAELYSSQWFVEVLNPERLWTAYDITKVLDKTPTEISNDLNWFWGDPLTRGRNLDGDIVMGCDAVMPIPREDW